jgi:hypothetical protein
MTEWERIMRNNIAQARAQDPDGVQNPRLAEFLDASEQFLADYQDVVKDDALVRAMLRHDATLAAEFPRLAPMQRLRAAANHVRSGSQEPVEIAASQTMEVQDIARGRAGYRAQGWTRQAEWEGYRARMAGKSQGEE